MVGQFFQSLSLALTRGAAGLDGGQPDDHPGVGRAVPGAAADARARPDLHALAGGYEGLLRAGLRLPRRPSVLALLAVVPGWWLFGTWNRASCPTWTKGPSSSITTCPSGTSLVADRQGDAPRGGRCCCARPTWPATSAAPAPRLGLFATEPFTRRHPREPQAARPAPAEQADHRCAARSSCKAKCPSWTSN